MLMKLLMGMSLCFIMSSMTLNSPILMALNILLVSIMLAMMMSIMVSSWYAILMFLIYIGGMMIMFSYFIALTPNQTLKMKSYFAINMMTLSLILPPMIFFMNNLNIKNNMMMCYDLYLMNMKPITMMMILILLMMLLIIVKLVKISSGPLRPFN
uniref:NADH dehydrogenase subunit 6 n=1 Tax=Pterobdella arugamensis TaxID=3410361 RepID=A0A343B6W4_9ANNE|nr:NADH dehydrogenase subunit 6 [Zeylanicobdella arugamensis]AQT26247.1 NADH dehydrogenase subunit 6 [Zeylanicobdella arugamensis]